MGIDVVGWTAQQLSESGLDDDVGLLVLAALEGETQLDEYLATGHSGTAVDFHPPVESDVRNPGGTFLTSITVEGFRGIGPRASLTLDPAPGLTIVAGRNGSGKSSFSEALEYVLTGNTYRWKNRPAQWRERWRNLHHPSARIDIGLVEESIGPFTISTEWADGQNKVDAGNTTMQRHGQKKQAGHGDLGWDHALDQFRPILSYDELGGMLAGRPIDLHDALAKVLGTQQARDALDRLRSRQKQLKSPRAVAENKRKELRGAAQDVDDPRAADVAALLSSTKPDVAAIRAHVTGAYATEGPIAALRELAALSSPVTAHVATETAQRLRNAVAAVADVSDGGTALRESAVEIATKALAMHAAHGDLTCPVCRVGQLDGNWAASMTSLIEKTRSELEAVHTARRELELACQQAHDLLRHRPRVFDAEPVPGIPMLDDARRAWDLWLDVDRGTSAAAAVALAAHIEAHAENLEIAVGILADEAKERLDSMDQAWQVLGTRIGAWCDEWEGWLADVPTIERLEEATAWLQAAELRLRDERLEPIRAGAKDVWAKLRHQSNVELRDFKLQGAVQRKLVIDSTVDGVATAGLPVMSQGELHALALALFLPRASMPDSPFRFIVLDDPVQAMDPAKVDGLVDVLADLANTRQVIVFSHDDRLPAAVRRRADVHASIVEVVRGDSSRVTLESTSDPATRYLDDAFAFVKEWEAQKVDDEAIRRVLPGLLRFAVESAARDAYFNPQLAAGKLLVDLEKAWQDATTTRQKVALAVYGAPGNDGELSSWIAKESRRRIALGVVGRAMHDGLATDPLGAARAVERLVDDLRRLP